MCGIVGSVSFDSSTFVFTEPYIRRMRDTMTHRGPDGGGIWMSPDGRVGLGHRRLSIIDLSTVANQPMANEDGRLQVVFNGEIYNHAEVRKELEALGGHRWKTSHSDTCMRSSSGASTACTASAACLRSRCGTRASAASG